MITIEEALRIVLNHIKEAPCEVVDIRESLGLVLAEDMRAQDDIPPFANSAMDGYAVRSADIRGASRASPVRLRLVEDIPAGTVPEKAICRLEAAKIMTGAPIPRGADAIVPVEMSEENGRSVFCLGPAQRGDHIRLAGEDVAKDSIALRRGAIIRPQEMGLLAALGVTSIPVFRRPRVAILATGSELVGADEKPGPGRIRNCNSYSLFGLVKKYGGLPEDLGIVPDSASELRAKLAAAASRDVVVASGGVSVGDYDLVRKVLEEMGAEMKLWRVCMKPGKPLAFGTIGGKPVFGLPGNPVSVIVSFEQFVRPAILKMLGRKAVEKPLLDAVCEARIEKKTDRVNLVRARVERRGETFFASPCEAQGSGMLSSMCAANALIVLSKETAVVEAGQPVKVMMLDWPEET